MSWDREIMLVCVSLAARAVRARPAAARARRGARLALSVGACVPHARPADGQLRRGPAAPSARRDAIRLALFAAMSATRTHSVASRSAPDGERRRLRMLAPPRSHLSARILAASRRYLPTVKSRSIVKLTSSISSHAAQSRTHGVLAHAHALACGQALACGAW
jgi:hypothetical protein